MRSPKRATRVVWILHPTYYFTSGGLCAGGEITPGDICIPGYGGGEAHTAGIRHGGRYIQK